MLTKLSDRQWRRAGAAFYVVSGALTGVSLLSKAPLLAKVFGLPVPLAVIALAVACFTPALGLLTLRWWRWLAPLVLAATVCVAVVVAPRIEALHAVGRGTDQGTCISVAAGRAFSGLFPFDRAAMWSGNGMSCGLGWAVLHAPFTTTVGYPLAMVALLVGALGAVWAAAGVEIASRLLVLFGAVPGFWQGLANGNDFVTFGAALVALAVAATCGSSRVRWWATALSVPVSQFRLPFALLPALTADPAERRRAWTAVGVGGFLWAAVIAWNPGLSLSDGPLHVLRKATGAAPTALTIAAAAAVVVLMAAVGYALCARLTPTRALPVYAAVLLIPQSMLELGRRLAVAPDIAEALARWEGASWLVAVSLTAALLTLAPLPRPAVTPEPTREVRAAS